MAILTKAQLQADNSASFADNNNGAITPQILRDYNASIIDTLVDSLDTGSFVTTSSFNSYTASQSTASLVTSITNLNTFTSSQLTINTAIGASTSSLNTFSGSQITKDLTLAIYTASVDTKFTAVGASTSSLNTFSGSQTTKNLTLANVTSSLISKTGSYATTASNTFTGQQILSNTSDLQFPLQIISGGIRIDVNDANDWMIYNGNINGGLKSISNNLNLLAQTGSLIIENTAGAITISGSSTTIQQVNFIPFSASLNTSVSNLNTATASLFTSTSLSLTTASFSGNTLTFTKGNGTTFGVVIPDVSGSTLPAGTISSSAQITSLGFVSSSVTASSLVTASVSLNTITFTKGDATTFAITVNTGSGGGGTIATGSFATTGSNSFNGNQTITGSLNVRNITTLGLNPTPSTANTGSGTSLYFLNQDINGGAQPSIYNITAGWVMSGTGITNGTVTSVGGDGNGISVNITSGNVVSGSSYIGTGPYAKNLIITGGVSTDNGFGSPGGLTIQNQDGTGVQGGGIAINSSGVDQTNIFSTLVVYGDTSEAKMVIGLSSYTNEYNGQPVPTIYAGGYYNGSDTTMTFFSSSIQNWMPTQFKAGVEITGSLRVSNTFTASLQQGYAWVGGSGNRTIAVATSSFAGTTVNTGSLMRTGSVSGNVLTFTKGDATTFSLTVSTGSATTIPAGTVSSSAQILNYGIFATTGSNTFKGSQTISGSLIQSGAVSIQGDITFTNKNGDNSNVILGSGAMTNITGSVMTSIAIGANAMRYASASQQNVAIGQNALAVTVGTNNTAIGSEAMANNTTGGQNLAFGVGAMNKNTTGATNVAIGNDALFYNISSSFNIAIGASALQNNQTDSQIAIGGGALQDTTNGNVNIAIGRSTMQKNTTGYGNTALGANAMQNATGSSNNIVIGNAAMQNATSTDDNVAIGVGTMAATQGSKNTAIGRNSLGQDTTGQQNTAIGYNSGYGITTGNYNTLIGSATGSASWNNVIALSDGQGNIEAIYSGSVWSMKAPVNFTTGSNQQAGTAVLNGGNPGTVTVSNSLVTANSIIMLTKQTLTNAHSVGVSAKSGGSFTITSTGNGDSDTVGWFIINNS